MGGPTIPVAIYQRMIVIGNAMISEIRSDRAILNEGLTIHTSYTPSEIEKQKDVSDKAAHQRGSIEPNTPMRVGDTYRILIFSNVSRLIICPPGRYKGSYRHDVGQGPNCRGEERNCGRGKPPILWLVILIWPHSKTPS